MKREDETKQLQRRRLKAGRLLLKGVAQAEVARRMGVSRPTVFEWKQRLEQGGLEALKNGTRGRPGRLDAAMRAQLAQALLAGARTHGYATELWTLPRIAKLIEERFGHSYSISQVSRLLAVMGWSCQRPEKRALQRDEKAIRQWKAKRWPALKKTPHKSDARSSS
jgi:transposase